MLGHPVHQKRAENDDEKKENLSQLTVENFIKVRKNNQKLAKDELISECPQGVHKKRFFT